MSAAQPGFAATTLLVAAVVVGCAGSGRSDSDTGPVIGEVGTPSARARAHTELASAYLGRGNVGVALEETRLALRADSSYAPAYNVLGLVHMELRENQQAEDAFERALRLDPGDPDTNHNFGLFLCQTGREEQGVRHFLAAVRNPLYALPQKTYALAASCVLKKNNEKEAVDFFDRSLRLDPTYPPALIGLAQLKYRRGELGEAKALVGRYNKAVEPTAESLWLALRVERRLGDRVAESSFASQLRRRFAGSKEYQDLQKGRFE
ncbi:MAG: type IV pilus biogenesis/stability protein PilW [Pyrinomonadaceae bacterium]